MRPSTGYMGPQCYLHISDLEVHQTGVTLQLNLIVEFAVVVNVRISSTGSKLKWFQTTDQNDRNTKPMVDHNSEQVQTTQMVTNVYYDNEYYGCESLLWSLPLE